LSRPRMVSGVEHGRRSGVLILRGSRGGWLEDDSDIGRGSAWRDCEDLFCMSGKIAQNSGD
jgi:hypothetical protein